MLKKKKKEEGADLRGISEGGGEGGASPQLKLWTS